MSPRSQWRVADGRFIKTAPAEQLALEVEKARSAEAIGRSSGLFRVPRVHAFDAATCTAEFEYIEGLRSIRSVLTSGAPEGEGLLRRLGRAVALFQERLTLPAEHRRPLPQWLSGPGPEVWIHGDLSVDNVCVDPEGGLVILDWQTTARVGGEATVGSAYFDLGWFLKGLFQRPGYSALFRDPIGPWADALVSGYLRASTLAVRREGVKSSLVRCTIRNLPRPILGWDWQAQLAFPRGMMLMIRWLRSAAPTDSEREEE